MLFTCENRLKLEIEQMKLHEWKYMEHGAVYACLTYAVKLVPYFAVL